MAENSKIEWTDATWNPVLGCDKISPGCKNCYAIRTAWRLQHNPNPKVAKAFEGLTMLQGGQPNWTGRVNFVEERLKEPLKWAKPRKVFVNSQSDLFHENVTDEQRDQIFAVMAEAHRHTFQILTKRPETARRYLSGNDLEDRLTELWAEGKPDRETWSLMLPLKNVWLGVSVENQQYADERIPLLLQTPAAVRWISAEPLLGPVSLRWAAWDDHGPHPRRIQQLPDVQRNGKVLAGSVDHLDGARMLDWCVAGGESGPNARPMHPEWARSLRDQCQAAGVPFFFKQWGEWANGSDYRKEELCLYRDGRSCDFTQEAILTEERKSGIEHRLSGGTVMAKLGKKAAGRLLDGKEHSEYPEAHAH